VKSSYAERSGSMEEGGGGGRAEGTRRVDPAPCTVDPREEDSGGRVGGWRGGAVGRGQRGCSARGTRRCAREQGEELVSWRSWRSCLQGMRVWTDAVAATVARMKAPSHVDGSTSP
jgi:hypothetical protein